MSINNRDNTLQRARNLGRLSGNRRINGLVGAKDKTDFVKFTLSEVSEFGLTLGRVAGRASARISLRNSGGSILQSFVSGPRPKAFRSDLAAGTYYVGVQRLRGEVNYRLTAFAGRAEPGEGLSTARDIGVLSGTYTNQEAIGSSDSGDLYKFTLNDIVNLQARVDSSAASTRLELIRDANSNGLVDVDEIVASGVDFSAPFLSSVTEDLPSGVYYVRVGTSSSSASTPYRIDLVAAPFGGTVSPEPGNTLPSARDLGALAGTFTAKEYVGKVDAIDLYRFTLNDISNVQFSVTGASENTRIQLIRDRNGNGLIDNDEVLASDTNFGSSFLSSVTQDLPAGSYFVSVEPRNTSTRYDLSLVATPFGGTLSPDPGNSLPAARDLGVLSGTFTAREHVGLLDSDDYYRFTLGVPGSLQARVNGASAHTRIQLIQDLNGNGLIDNGETLANDTRFGSTFLSDFTRSLSAGTYFFRVSPRDTSGATNYAVSLTV